MTPKKRSNLHWLELHEMLMNFKTEKRHTNVPVTYEKCPALGNYVRNLRQVFRQEKEGAPVNRNISDAERESLDAMGFEWMLPKKKREYWQNLKELLKFKADHGHCNVPEDYVQDKELAQWCKKLRAHPPGKERYQKLVEIGFLPSERVLIHDNGATTNENMGEGDNSNNNRGSQNMDEAEEDNDKDASDMESDANVLVTAQKIEDSNEQEEEVNNIEGEEDILAVASAKEDAGEDKSNEGTDDEKEHETSSPAPMSTKSTKKKPDDNVNDGVEKESDKDPTKGGEDKHAGTNKENYRVRFADNVNFTGNPNTTGRHKRRTSTRKEKQQYPPVVVRRTGLRNRKKCTIILLKCWP